MKHLLYIAVTFVLIGGGLIILPLPIPLGAPMIAIGVTILISHSRTAARALMGLRLRSPRVNRAVHLLEIKAPETIARSLKRTRPEGLRLFGRAP